MLAGTFVLSGARRERVDDPAFGDRPTAALVDHAREFAAQSTQVCDLAVHCRQMRLCDGTDRLAGARLIIR